jgi:hypothetical protein
MTKELELFNFKKIADFNVDRLKTLVESLDAEWLLDTSRQESFETHKHTLSYFIYKADLLWKKGSPFFVETNVANMELLDAVEGIVQDLEAFHNGTRGNVLLIKLLAGQDIPEHVDSGDYLTTTRRHHLPIVTSPGTIFGVGIEELNMQEGECWEINNTRTHYVQNNSEIDRVHLLIDIMPLEER